MKERQPCIVRKGLFDRWYIFHPTQLGLAWGGAHWVKSSAEGLPMGSFQVCNFPSEQDAQEYCCGHELEPFSEDRTLHD